jgi:hypothetical protein
MRRLLPVLFCAATSTGLAACDQEPVGPHPDDEQVFYDAARAAGGFPGAPAFADGDMTLSRPAGGGGDGGGGDIIVFDIVDSVARDADGLTIQVLTTDSIASPNGDVLCTKTQSGGFAQLRDADGDVLFSTVGPLVFDGQPNLAGKNPIQQGIELASHLRFSFDFTVMVEGSPSGGEDLVVADVPIQFSSGWRKLVVASLVVGYCGSDGLPEE